MAGMTSKVIAIANQKGGVAKTTTAVNLGHGLALRGDHVLLVDLDAQSNVARHLGLAPIPSLFRVIVSRHPVVRCLTEARPNLDVLLSDKSTAEAKEILAGRNFRELALKNALEAVDGYEYILLDCAPSLDILNICALVAADYLLIPIAVDYLATVGARDHLSSLAELRAAGHDVQLKWVVPTFYDGVTRESKEILGQLVEAFKGLVTAPIRRNVRLREAPAYGQSIWEYAPRSTGAQCYARLLERVIADVQEKAESSWRY